LIRACIIRPLRVIDRGPARMTQRMNLLNASSLAVLVALAVVSLAGCGDEVGPAPSSGGAGSSTSGGATTGGAGSTGGGAATGGTGATSGAGATGNSGASGAGTSSGASSAGGSAGSSAGDSAGGMTSAGGAGASAGTSGTNATGGAGDGAGGGGNGGATAGGGAGEAGTTAAGGSSSGTSGRGGDGGKACQSEADWTPKADDLWIAPSGNDSNPGTQASPKKNLPAAIAAWSSGKTIWVTPGTYAHGAPITITTNASEAGPLRISGVTGGAMPVFDFSSEPRASNNDGQRGFELSGSYVHLRYLEIERAADNCVYVTGSGNTLEWLSVHECQDTGVQLSNGAADNDVRNVDSYLNADPTGENADGFAPKLSIGQNNYFCGTRAYQNADDGYDCWAAGDDSPVTFDYCWAFGQPGPTATASSDGNGFKLGSPADRAAGGNAPHELIACFAFENRGAGFTANGNHSGEITCTGCGTWENGSDWSPGTGGQDPQHTGDITNLNVSVEQAMNAPRDANGNLPDITQL
jgi:hypothetical protein